MPTPKRRPAQLSELSDAIFGEIKARTKETDLSVPTYTSHPGGACLLVLRTHGGGIGVSDLLPGRGGRSRARCQTPNSEISGEEVLLDGNVEAGRRTSSSPSARSACPSTGDCSHTRSICTGAERFTIMSARTWYQASCLPDQIDDTAYGVAWAKNSHLFYTRADEAWRPYVVLRHRLGDRPVARRRRC